MITTAALIYNNYRFECSVTGFQDKAVWSGELDAVCESMGKCTQRFTIFY